MPHKVGFGDKLAVALVAGNFQRPQLVVGYEMVYQLAVRRPLHDPSADVTGYNWAWQFRAHTRRMQLPPVTCQIGQLICLQPTVIAAISRPMGVVL